MEEIWKDIEGFEGLYKVSNLGRVKSLARLKQMPTGGFQVLKETIKRQKINKGYCYIGLSKDGVKCQRKVHRLVCAAFHDNPLNKPDVNHKDCVKTNNKASNLEWSTEKENYVHATENGLHFYPDVKGERNGRSKLTKQQVNEILESKSSYSQLAAAYNVTKTAIGKIKRGELWNTL